MQNNEEPHTPQLVDSGLIGNYIDTQECTTHGIKVEAEDQGKEPKMADGTVVRI